MVKFIEIYGKEWFQTSYGNTYHSVVAYIDKKEVYREPFAYGSQHQYKVNAMKAMCELGLIPFDYTGFEFKEWCEKNGYEFISECEKVTRKKDLTKGMFW